MIRAAGKRLKARRSLNVLYSLILLILDSLETAGSRIRQRSTLRIDLRQSNVHRLLSFTALILAQFVLADSSQPLIGLEVFAAVID